MNNFSKDVGGEGVKAIGQTEVYIRTENFIYLDIPRPHDRGLRLGVSESQTRLQIETVMVVTVTGWGWTWAWWGLTSGCTDLLVEALTPSFRAIIRAAKLI